MTGSCVDECQPDEDGRGRQHTHIWFGAMSQYVISENLEAAQSGLGLEDKTEQWEKRLESCPGAGW